MRYLLILLTTIVSLSAEPVGDDIKPATFKEVCVKNVNLAQKEHKYLNLCIHTNSKKDIEEIKHILILESCTKTESKLATKNEKESFAKELKNILNADRLFFTHFEVTK
jgi:hypothetical protein